MDSDEEEEKEVTKGPKFPIQMFISEGNKYLRLAKYETAIEFFNTALQKDPTNESSLIGRSRCLMQLGKFSEAKEDALAALKAHPRSCDAKMLIGEIEYFFGDFEKSFLTFYRGHQSRKNHEGLKLGHQMCRKGVDNALQPDIPMIIDNQDVNDLSKLEDRLEKDQPEIITGKDQYSRDVEFINSLLDSDPDENIRSHCMFLKSYIRNRQMFWKTQNPTARRKSKISGAVVKKTNDEADGDLIDSSEKAKSIEAMKENIYSSDKALTSQEICTVQEQKRKGETENDTIFEGGEIENDTVVEEGETENDTIFEEGETVNDTIFEETTEYSVEETTSKVDENEIKADNKTTKIIEEEDEEEEQMEIENEC